MSALPSRRGQVLLIRQPSDVNTPAETASLAKKIVIVAEGKERAWATLATTTARAQHGQDVFYAASAGSSGRVQTMADQGTEGWNADHYSRQLLAGTKRALCLGRRNSRISLARPVEGATIMVAANDSFDEEVRVEDFEMDEDGKWCVTANGSTVLYVLRNRPTLAVYATSSAGDPHDWATLLDTADHGGEPQEESGSGVGDVGEKECLCMELRVEIRRHICGYELNRAEKTTVLIHPTCHGPCRTHPNLLCATDSGTTSCDGGDQDPTSGGDNTEVREVFRASFIVYAVPSARSFVLVAANETLQHCRSECIIYLFLVPFILDYGGCFVCGRTTA